MIDIQDPNTDPGSYNTGTNQQWWQGPPPAGWTGAWPPPLPPGASYGPDPGSVIYTPSPSPIPGGQPTTQGPVNPNPADSYNPGAWGNTPQAAATPTASTPGTIGGAVGAPASTAAPAPAVTPVATPSTPGPSPNLPSVPNAAPYRPPPAFSYPDFKGPTAQDVLNDPSYQFELQQGLGAIGHKAAALGTLNTGGTIGDYVNYGQGLASQHWQDVYNNQFNTYAANRQNALDAYNTNYQTQYRDPYLTNYQTQVTDPFAMGSQNAMAQYGAAQQNYNQGLYYQSHANDLNQYYNFANKQFDWQRYLDQFNMQYNLLNQL